MKALVIVDVQNDFTPGGNLQVPHGDIIVPVINNLQKYFDLVVATQDWHPQNHNSFASNHTGKKPFDKIMLNGREQILWPDHCIQGSYGADFNPLLETEMFSAIFRKGMNPDVDSYSGFNDNNNKISTGLGGYLREKGITDLYFCGLAADICVYYSVMDSLKEGFRSTLIEDASRPLSNENYATVKYQLLKIGGHFINSIDIF
jgi:nicotinamidase/pyrazinamidase